MTAWAAARDIMPALPARSVLLPRVGRFALRAFFLACLLGCRAVPAAAPLPPFAPPQEPLALSNQAWMVREIERGWRFATDPRQEGATGGWALPGFDDRGWDILDAGALWDQQGYAGYTGVAWYRRWVEVPPSWGGRRTFLVLGGVNDEVQVYVDGQPVGRAGDRAAGRSAIASVAAFDLTGRLPVGGTALLALEVRSWYDHGGLARLPVALTTAPEVQRTPLEELRRAAAEESDGVWPRWLRDGGRAWTVAAAPGGGPRALVGLEGAAQPAVDGGTLEAWVYDRAARHLATPEQAGVTLSLEEPGVVVPTARWQAGPVEVRQRLVVAGGGSGRGDEGLTALWEVRVRAGGGPAAVDLLVAARPYQVAGTLAPAFSLRWDPAWGALAVNGRLALLAQQRPDSFGASTLATGDVSRYATRGQVPPWAAAEDGQGYASGLLRYRLRLAAGEERAFTFVAPVQAGAWRGVEELEVARGRDFGRALAAVAQGWRALGGSLQLEAPDPRVAAAYRASLAYVLSGREGDLLHPGPLLHHAFWYRDASYMTRALEVAGLGEQAEALLAPFARFQLKTGEFPAHVSTRPIVGKPRGQPEWDAQGQGIVALVEHYAMQRDRAWLARAYPTIRQAAEFQRRLRPEGGILPPGESAEDLGPLTWHHYWDDFWGIAGLRAAARAAHDLGQAQDEQRFTAEADGLLAATRASIAAVQRATGVDYIPNGPEDVRSSAMARGTTAALWPSRVLPAEDEGLLAQSFRVYYDRFVRPYDGAFRHADSNYWSLGGLELAHAALFLAHRDWPWQSLDWLLTHQTLPGAYAWADEITPATGLLGGGDMPHGWAAAEMALLLRDLLLYEDGARLVLGAGIPQGWLDAGQVVGIHDAPTTQGRAGYRLESHLDEGYLALSLEGVCPAGGYRMALPLPQPIVAVRVNGRAWGAFSANLLELPPQARRVEIWLTAPTTSAWDGLWERLAPLAQRCW